MLNIDMRSLILGITGAIRPVDARCARAVETVSELLDFPGIDPFGRDAAHGHITASGFILSPDRTETLLLHHAKLDRWLQPGGHCDGEADPLSVARRELEEETGLTGLRLLCEAPVDMDRHRIPARGAEPEHWHYDLRYLFEADRADDIVRNHESREIRWIPIEELEAYTDSPAVLVIRDLAAAFKVPASPGFREN